MTVAADRALLEELPPVKVLCVGDLMLDRFSYGVVERISQEAPIPVLRVDREQPMPGAAGNVAANLHALDVAVELVALVGDDAAGREVSALVAEMVDGAPPLVESGRRTTVKSRYIADGQQLLRADRERIEPPASAIEQQIIDRATETMVGCDVAILSDYGKGVLTERVISQTIAAANAAGKPVVVDPKGNDYGYYRGATVVTPNQKELAEAAGLPTESDDQAHTASKAVLNQSGIQSMVATRGAKGMLILTEADAEPLFLGTQAQEVFDVSGAGDTVVAVLAMALGAGADLKAAARLANLAAGLVVAKPGTATVTRDDLFHAMTMDAWAESEAKVVAAASLPERVAAWRRNGKRIGFTNGCFDLLHPGHIQLLREARATCDRLIVGLNSDASVVRLKGPDRPVQGEAARTAVLAALESVDLVAVFDEDTPLSMIEAIRPDVLIKGADYTVEQVVGAKEVMGWGGEVVLAPIAEGHSTTRLVDRSRS
ncbi:MAG: D-glycero-beta-D-manno-heptose 1-phosphate adenylyltransferase [Pseudomonadota bacterium]